MKLLDWRWWLGKPNYAAVNEVISQRIERLLSLACVIIPAHNESLVIRKTIQSVLDAGIRARNIIVIDDASSDATSRIARAQGVIVVQNKRNMGKTRSIACLVKQHKLDSFFRYATILDADTVVVKDYFRVVIRRFIEDDAVAVVCGQVTSMKGNWLTDYRAMEYAFVHAAYKEVQSKFNIITISSGCASTYRVSTLKKLEWHPEHIIIEDADATPQIHRKRLGRIVYEKDAVVVTQDPDTLRGYAGQLHRWYTGIWQAIKFYRMPFGFQRIDAECALFMFDHMFLSLFIIFILPMLAVFQPWWALQVVIWDQVIQLSIALWFMVKTQRFGFIRYVTRYAYLFFGLRVLNAVIYLYTFFSVAFERNRPNLPWFHVERYAVNADANQEVRDGVVSV